MSPPPPALPDVEAQTDGDGASRRQAREDEAAADERTALLAPSPSSSSSVVPLLPPPRHNMKVVDRAPRHGRAVAAADEVQEEQEEDRRKADKFAVKVLRVLLVLLVVMFVLLGLAIVVKTLNADPAGPRNPAYLIRAEHGAVASENVICSNIGVDVLKDGGSATDAAIATCLCIGTLNMFSSGIGGGGFMTIRPGSSSRNSTSSNREGGDGDDDYPGPITIDFRETAPALANTTMYVGRPHASQVGGLAVGVPGELRGLQEAHKQFGKLEWRRLVEPSARLATEGWKVQKHLAFVLGLVGDFMLTDPDWSMFLRPRKRASDPLRLVREGDLIRREAYGRTLYEIADKGADVFYEGPIADALVAKINATGGILQPSDLTSYRAIVAPALQGTYRGYKVYTTNTPTSGPVLLSMLNIVEGWKDWKEEGRTGKAVHRIVEAMKHGSAQRTELGDPAFIHNERRIREITTKAEADRVRANISDDRTHPVDYYHPRYDINYDHGTTHLSVIDADGEAVALTSTVNLIFGSQVMDPVTGVILNDQLDDTSTPGTPNAFGLRPSPFNYPEPGKRPLSSTSPTVIERPDGSLYLTIGGSGGSRIFGSVFQVILNLEWGFDVSKAIEEPRVHHQLLPTPVSIETTYPSHLIDELKERGHEVNMIDIRLGIASVEAVLRDDEGVTWAASDSRKDGVAAGY